MEARGKENGVSKIVADVELLEGDKVKVFFQNPADESDITSATYDLGALGGFPVLTQAEYERLLGEKRELEILELYGATLVFFEGETYVLAG